MIDIDTEGKSQKRWIYLGLKTWNEKELNTNDRQVITTNIDYNFQITIIITHMFILIRILHF